VLGGSANEPTCGRPLGMRLDADGYLMVCDTTLGLHKINVATGAWSCALLFLVIHPFIREVYVYIYLYFAI